jgi:hypothetical protein
MNEEVERPQNGFKRWQKFVVVLSLFGFVFTGIYGLRYNAIYEGIFIASLCTFFGTFFAVMCKNCEKDCPFNWRR